MIIQTLIVFAICSHNDHNQILTPYVSIVCATSDCLFVLLCTHIDHNQIWSLHVLIVCGRWDLMSMSSALKLVSQQMTLRTEGEIMLKGLMLSISLQEGQTLTMLTRIDCQRRSSQTFHPTFPFQEAQEFQVWHIINWEVRIKLKIPKNSSHKLNCKHFTKDAF